jgi:hypothetical protein
MRLYGGESFATVKLDIYDGKPIFQQHVRLFPLTCHLSLDRLLVVASVHRFVVFPPAAQPLPLHLKIQLKSYYFLRSFFGVPICRRAKIRGGGL